LAAFLTTDAISSEIRKTVTEARTEITLLSSNFKLTGTLFGELKKAHQKGVMIVFCYSKASFTEDQVRWFAQAGKVDFYHSRNLHANCYFNEDRMVITSMTLEELSARVNREMGILIRRERDKESHKKAINEVQSILDSARKLDPRAESLSGSDSFLKQDMEKTVEDMRSAMAFLKKDLEKTKRDLNKEISLRPKARREKAESSSQGE